MSKRKAESEHGAEHRAEDLMNELFTSSDFNLEEQSPAELRWKKARKSINQQLNVADAFNSSLSEFMEIAKKCGLILDEMEYGIAIDALLKEISNEEVSGGNETVLSEKFLLELQKELTTTSK